MTTPQKESIELLAQKKYPAGRLEENNCTRKERAAFIAGYSAALEEQAKQNKCTCSKCTGKPSAEDFYKEDNICDYCGNELVGAVAFQDGFKYHYSCLANLNKLTK